jgi:hypothetical protein
LVAIYRLGGEPPAGETATIGRVRDEVSDFFLGIANWQKSALPGSRRETPGEAFGHFSTEHDFAAQHTLPGVSEVRTFQPRR